MHRLLGPLVALVSGLIFGIGLMSSGMTDPANVIGFLDVAGRWNPALALVMGGAVLVTLPAFAYARKHHHSLDGTLFQLPDRTTFSRPLVIGSAMFGIGWGLSGVCPGPGILIATGDGPGAGLFFISMLGGMFAHELWARRALRTIQTGISKA